MGYFRTYHYAGVRREQASFEADVRSGELSHDVAHQIGSIRNHIYYNSYAWEWQRAEFIKKTWKEYRRHQWK